MGRPGSADARNKLPGDALVSGDAVEERQLRIGVAGLERVFSLMLPTFLADWRIQLVVACSPRGESRQQFAKNFSATTYVDVTELAADPNVEAVYIASTHQFDAPTPESRQRQQAGSNFSSRSQWH